MSREQVIEMATPTEKDRKLAGFVHLLTILDFTGILIQIAIAFLVKKRSFAVAAQAIQAAIFNVLLLAIILFVSYAAMLPFLDYLAPEEMTPQTISDLTICTVYYSIFILFIYLVLMTPAIIGAIRIFRGKHFHYPLFGLPIITWFYLLDREKETEVGVENEAD